jgi:dipeptidyl-peptidase 4
MLRSMRHHASFVVLLSVTLLACSTRSSPRCEVPGPGASSPLAPAPPAPPAPLAAELLPEAASQITFEDMARFPEPGWQVPRALGFSPDGSTVTFLMSDAGSEEMSLFTLDDQESAPRPLVRASQLVTSHEKSLAEELRDERQRKRIKGITQYQWAAKKDVMLVPMGANLFLVTKDGSVSTAREGTDVPIDPKMCADGSRIAYSLGSELAVLDVTKKEETLLTKGAPSGVTRGQSDFNAQEEFDEPSGHFFSPDCRRLVYLEVDESGVAEVPILGHRGGKPALQPQRYPEAGKANPKVTVHVLDLETKKDRLVPLPEAYLGRLQFVSDSSFVISTLDRSQRKLEISRVDLGKILRVTKIHERRVDRGWISMSDVVVSSDGKTVVTVAEREGHDHLLAIDVQGASAERFLTGGDWDVTELVASSATRPAVFFSANRTSQIGRTIHELDLSTGGERTVAEERGTNVATFSRSGDAVATLHSDVTRPPWMSLRRGSARTRVELPTDAQLVRLHKSIRTPELFRLERPGLPTLHGALLPPRVVDPTRTYPLVVMVYGGPGAQTVLDRWSPRLHWQHLADRGFYVMQVDNRGSAGRGPAFERAIDRNLGKVEMEDQIAALADVVARTPTIDPTRVGIYGHSYGGFLAAHAMLTRGSGFAIGIAGSPVTDWRLYDSAYTERYMGLPSENAAGYEASRLAARAGDLQGRLLLMHALMDENVHFQNSADLVDALVTAGKDFDVFVFPGERHGYRSKGARTHALGRVTRALVEALGPRPE